MATMSAFLASVRAFSPDTCFVLRGLPGAGKSFLAAALVAARPAEALSADDFFLDAAGDYRFDATRLADAHRACFKRAAASAAAALPFVIDNTNLTAAEYAPYMTVAEAFGFRAVLVTVDQSPEVCFRRQVHGVPFDAFVRMVAKMERDVVPSRFNHFTVAGEVA